MCGWTGHIHLEKNLPNGAGIGGGSSDAAAVLRDLGGPLAQAASLGADVPVCLSPAPQRMRGIGDVLDPIVGLPALPMVLVNPGSHVPTPKVFQALTAKENALMSDLPAEEDVQTWLALMAVPRNDLQAAALTCAPQIAKALAALDGADLVRMSGSGSTCFGLYKDPASAQAAAEEIAREHPDWWVQSCEAFGSKR